MFKSILHECKISSKKFGYRIRIYCILIYTYYHHYYATTYAKKKLRTTSTLDSKEQKNSAKKKGMDSVKSSSTLFRSGRRESLHFWRTPLGMTTVAITRIMCKSGSTWPTGFMAVTRAKNCVCAFLLLYCTATVPKAPLVYSEVWTP